MLDGMWLAGGAARKMVQGDDPFNSDLDLYFKSHEVYFRYKELMKEHGYKKTSSNKGTTKLSNNIFSLDLIKARWYASPEEVINSFDFTVCQFALDRKGELTCGTHSKADLKNMVLRIHNFSDPISTMRRIAKYVDLT